MSSLTVHCIVKNEEKWIWYAISSILDIAKTIFVYDTGSTDKTVEIIKTIKNKKIVFEQKGSVDAKDLVSLRREQLARTKTEWFLILDGDEIWPEETKRELFQKLEKAQDSVLGVVVRAWNFVGDIYHYHPESTRYHWPFAPKGYLGWANLRVVRTATPGLAIRGEYPLEAYCDQTGTPIQNYGKRHLEFLQNRYLHTTYLLRSTNRQTDKNILNRSKKAKKELGISFPKNFVYPQVFYQQRPSIVAAPWVKRSALESVLAFVETPFKEARRRFLGLYQPKGTNDGN